MPDARNPDLPDARNPDLPDAADARYCFGSVRL